MSYTNERWFAWGTYSTAHYGRKHLGQLPKTQPAVGVFGECKNDLVDEIVVFLCVFCVVFAVWCGGRGLWGKVVVNCLWWSLVWTMMIFELIKKRLRKNYEKELINYSISYIIFMLKQELHRVNGLLHKLIKHKIMYKPNCTQLRLTALSWKSHSQSTSLDSSRLQLTHPHHINSYPSHYIRGHKKVAAFFADHVAFWEDGWEFFN